MTSRPWLAHYDPGVPARLEYPSIPAFELLEQAARACPERACLLFGETRLSYQEVSAQSDRIAAGLRGLGVRRGERVGLLMPNCPEFILAYFGILKAGAVVVATNPLYTPAEIAHQVNDAGVGTIFSSAPLYERVKSAQAETRLGRVIVSGAVSPLPGDLPFEALLTARPGRLPAVRAGQAALFQYTGGTTGVAKAAVARHRNLVANALQFAAWMSTLQPERETFLLALPVYHIYGMVCGLLLGMALRASLVVLPDPRDISALLSAIQRHRVSYFPAVPTLYNAINSHPDVTGGRTDLTSIKACISGSAPLRKETKETFERLTGGRIVEGYGLSEAPTATHCNPLQGENRLGSIGLPLPDVEARIVSLADGRSELPPGEAGELVLRSPQVMRGYHGRRAETRRALRRGWLYTGDVARMEADGYFTIVDRKKELIKPGGMQVWPGEVEQALNAHPAVQEAAVAGIPDDYRGETVKAWVVLRPGGTAGVEELQEWCRTRLAAFKVPTEIEFRPELPRSTVGKVLKRELVKQTRVEE